MNPTARGTKLPPGAWKCEARRKTPCSMSAYGANTLGRLVAMKSRLQDHSASVARPPVTHHPRRCPIRLHRQSRRRPIRRSVARHPRRCPRLNPTRRVARQSSHLTRPRRRTPRHLRPRDRSGHAPRSIVLRWPTRHHRTQRAAQSGGRAAPVLRRQRIRRLGRRLSHVRCSRRLHGGLSRRRATRRP